VSSVPDLPSFAELAAEPDPALDALTLAMAAEFRVCDASAASAELDRLGEQVSRAAAGTGADPRRSALACGRMLGRELGFSGDRRRYDNPENSMLDLVLVRRRGLPILLSVVYVEVARRAGIPLRGVGLPGHFVVGHFGCDPPMLLDPFNGGGPIDPPAPDASLRPWRSHEIAWRMLNNLLAAYQRRGDLRSAIRAAQMRLMLPVEGPLHDAMDRELRALQARLN
jgi:regulator of sirC expression with transglutaminase-like and TPR domain